MKAVVQRVLNASVCVNGAVIGSIDMGLLVYLGVAHNDNETDADWLCEKIANLRIFDDAQGKMNLSLKDKTKDCLNAGVLAISQFTLLADAKKGRRPSWNAAAPALRANELYQYFIKKIREQDIPCQSGEFQAHMKVNYTNDGPVTIILDTKS